MKIVDQTKIYRDYKGQWVVLDSSGTKVLAADKKLDGAIAKFRAKFSKKDIPLTFKVPTKITAYIGC